VQETRYRRRYLDGIVNLFVRENFVTRAAIIRYIRRFFDDRDFLEVLISFSLCTENMLCSQAGDACSRLLVFLPALSIC